MKKIKTCIFPVAGLGTRFLPATKSIPKEMLVVVDKPLIQYAVEEAKAAGIERFVFVTSMGKTAIEDHFDTNPILEQTLLRRNRQVDLDLLQSISLEPGQAVYVRQNAPLGLGHAVLCARHLVDQENFALILADDLVLNPKPCLQQMMEAHQSADGNMVAVMDVPKDQTNKYGILDVKDSQGQKITAHTVVEKPTPEKAPSNVAIIGRYVLSRKIFDYLENQAEGAGGEVQLTDAIQAMSHETPITGFRYEGTRFDCGTKSGWLEANLAFAYTQPDLWAGLQHVVQKYCLPTAA